MFSLLHAPPRSGRSQRPALTTVVVLALADHEYAERLLHDPLTAVSSYTHYPLRLDDRDAGDLRDASAQATTVSELLTQLAVLADGSAELPLLAQAYA